MEVSRCIASVFTAGGAVCHSSPPALSSSPGPCDGSWSGLRLSGRKLGHRRVEHREQWGVVKSGTALIIASNRGSGQAACTSGFGSCRGQSGFFRSTETGMLRWASVEEATGAADRLSSVVTSAGRSKKGRTSDGRSSGGRLEGSRRLRKEGSPDSGNPKTQTKPPDKRGETDRPPQKTYEGKTEFDMPPEPRRGKPKPGPKPRESVTQAGQPMLLVNKGERFIGKEFTPWTSDPRERQPDDYYKYGPFGPHAWKGVVVGTPRKGTFADNLVVFFSTVRNEEDHEKIAINDSIIGFDKRVDQMDESVGIQYYFAFVRQVQKLPYQAPWKEWTVVAQVAVESGEELDKWRLGFMFDRTSRENLTRCAAWFRPDLIYVKRPAYQIRFEPQREFLEGLLVLLNPDKEAKDPKSESYFGKLCQLLGVHEKEDEQQVGIIFDGLSEEKKMECLEHVLGRHPVELLTPFTRTAREEELKSKAEGGTITFDGSQGFDGEDENESGEDDEEGGLWDDSLLGEGDDDFEFEMEEFSGEEDDDDWKGIDWEREEAKALAAEAAQDSHAAKTIDEESWDEEAVQVYSEIDTDSPQKEQTADETDEETKKQNAGALLNAAVRPYTYTNLIKEIFIIRKALVDHPELREAKLCD